MKRHQVDLGDVSLSVLEHGTGKPLVFVHGSVTTSDLFADLLAYYGKRYRALAVDLRGYGASSKPGSGYSVTQFAGDLERLIRALDLGLAVVTGVSLGGWVVQRMALDHPERVAGLVLASTSDGALGPEIDLGAAVARIRREDWRRVSEELIVGAFPPDADRAVVDPLLSRIDAWNGDVLAGALDSARTFDTSVELAELAVPTLVLVGSEDHQLPVTVSERLRNAIPDARLHVFEGAGHFMMVEAPDEYRRVFDGFLREIGF